jgi:hypothetical protein
MEAHLEAQKERAKEIVNTLYSDIVELVELISEYMQKNNHLRVPDGVLMPINQFHRSYVISTDLRQVSMALHEIFPTVLMRPMVQGYNEVGAVGPVVVVTLYYAFYPKYNSVGYKIPHALDNPHLVSEYASLILLCQRAYSPAECDCRDVLFERIDELLQRVVQGAMPKQPEARKPASYLFKDTLAAPMHFAEAGCSISPNQNLLISGRGSVRLMAAKSKWPGIVEAITAANPKAAVKTISNTGRVPWDIRQESLLIKIDSRPLYKLYNNQDYELVPFSSINGISTVSWLVELRCVAMDLYLFSILNEVGQVRQLVNELCYLSKAPNRQMIGPEYSGIYFPVDEYETSVRLELAKQRANKRKGGFDAWDDLDQ